MKELAPTGTLRVGLVFAPVMSTFFVLKDEAGKPNGVTADIGEALAKKLNLPVEFVLFRIPDRPSTRSKSGAVDVSFMPVDARTQGSASPSGRTTCAPKAPTW